MKKAESDAFPKSIRLGLFHCVLRLGAVVVLVSGLGLRIELGPGVGLILLGGLGSPGSLSGLCGLRIQQCLQVGSAAGNENSDFLFHSRITFSSPSIMLPIT